MFLLGGSSCSLDVEDSQTRFFTSLAASANLALSSSLDSLSPLPVSRRRALRRRDAAGRPTRLRSAVDLLTFFSPSLLLRLFNSPPARDFGGSR